MPARVPPIARMPVRKPIDGIAAAKMPVNSSSGRIDGERTGSTQRRGMAHDQRDRAVAPTTVTPITTVIACSVGTVG